MKQDEIKEHIHKLGEGKSGKIRFIHFGDGKEHVYATTINSLSGQRLAWFDVSPPEVNVSVSEVKSVFRDIRKKATKIIEEIGDFKLTHENN